MKLIPSLLLMIMVGACAILPNSGPTRSGIFQSSTASGGDTHLVNVTKALAETMRAPTGYGFPAAFYSNSSTDYERIQPGDVLDITIWENTDEGVFATLGNRVTQLAALRVNEAGKVFVPYVGELSVSGRSADQLRKEITEKLETQTPFPQVEVRRTPGLRGGVLVFSSTGSGGLVPFNEGNLTLASMLASLGGAGGEPQSTRVTLTRGANAGTILLADIYDQTRNDVRLRDRDRITIETDRRFYRILGQGGAQSLVPFSRPEITLLDAISETGGLNANTADATGVFVFRTVDAAEANRLFGKQSFTTSQQFAFIVNMLEADGLFIADDFQIRDRDTIYITEAPFVTWTRVIASIASGINSFDTVNTLGNDILGFGRSTSTTTVQGPTFNP